jgi:predicted PurR-regulated permease PerM
MPPVVQPPPPPEPSPAEPSPDEPSAAEPSAAGTPPAEIAAPKVKRAGRADPPLQQRSVAALFLALLSLFGVLGLSNFQRGVYVVAFALVAGTMAVWLAATAMRRARRRGTAGPRGSVVAIVIGGVGVLISAVLLAGFALFGKQASTFSECLSGANTVAAQQTCRTQFTRAIENATH